MYVHYSYTNAWLTWLVPGKTVFVLSLTRTLSGLLFHVEISFWKWKLWPELHSQNEWADDWIPGKGLWFWPLWKWTVVAQLILLSEYGSRQSVGSCSGSCGTSVQSCTESQMRQPKSLHLPTLWEWLPQYKTILPVLPMFGSIHVCELSVSVSVWLMRGNQRKRVTPGWNLAYGQAGKSGLNGWTLNSHAKAELLVHRSCFEGKQVPHTKVARSDLYVSRRRHSITALWL